jgi:hypothetical protein
VAFDRDSIQKGKLTWSPTLFIPAITPTMNDEPKLMSVTYELVCLINRTLVFSFNKNILQVLSIVGQCEEVLNLVAPIIIGTVPAHCVQGCAFEEHAVV